jgi:tRNA threonylcarbamoyl adenosine modification protein YeaZ
MLILSVDTSSAKGSLALAENRKSKIEEIAVRSWEKLAMHSDVATLELQGLLADAGKSLSDVSHILVNHGPGSFTGLRVGINLARTLAYSLNLPILAIGTLELLAFRNSKSGQSVAVVVKALQNYVYAAIYKNGGDRMIEIVQPASIEASAIQEFSTKADLLCVDQTTSLDLRPDLSIDPLTSARTLVEYFAKSGEKFAFSSWKDIQPLYIRASEPEEKMRRGLLKPV